MLITKKIKFDDSKEMQSFFKSEKELADPSFVFYRLKNAAKNSRSNSLEKIIRKTAIYYELNMNDYYTAGRLYKLIGDIRFRRGHFYEAQSYYYLAYKNYTRNETHESKRGAAEMSLRCAQINEKLKRYEIARQNYFTAYKLFSKVNIKEKEVSCLSKDITLLAIIIVENGLQDKPVKYMENLLAELIVLAKILQREYGDKLSAAYIYRYVGQKYEKIFNNYELAKLNYFIASRLFEDVEMLKEAAEMNIKCGDLELLYGSIGNTFNDYMIAVKQYLLDGEELKAKIIVEMYIQYFLMFDQKQEAIQALLGFNKVYIETQHYLTAAENFLKCIEYENENSNRIIHFYARAGKYFYKAKNYLLSANTYLQGAGFAITRKNEASEIRFYSQAATSFSYIDRLQAAKCFEKYAERAENIVQDKIELALTLFNGAYNYKIIGELNKAKAMTKRAKFFYWELNDLNGVKKCDLLLSKIIKLLSK